MLFSPEANFLPQIPTFCGGEQRDGETVQDWLEHFEPVAGLAGWNKHFKFVHLISALRGAARSLYRSCTHAQKNDYSPLVSEHFTPEQLTAIQTQLFHSRRQEQKETVDDYAQELRKLHSKAYATVTYANPEAEKVGQMVLVNQFISGLRPELQSKVVGMEGNMDAVVLKARFEEAKAKEQTGKTQVTLLKKPPTASGPTSGPPRRQSKPAEESTRKQGGSRKCFNCGLDVHVSQLSLSQDLTERRRSSG